MKQKLSPNAELDILTKQELFEVVDYLEAKMVTPDSAYSSDFAVIKLDGSGNSVNPIEVPVYVCKGMQIFSCHVLSLDPDGFSAGASTVANGVTVKAGDRVVGVQQSAVMPGVFTWGTLDCPRLTSGEKLTVRIEGGPANGTVRVVAEGRLKHSGTK